MSNPTSRTRSPSEHGCPRRDKGFRRSAPEAFLLFDGTAFFAKPCGLAQACQYPKSPNTAANTITSDTASKAREQTGLSITLVRFTVLMGRLHVRLPLRTHRTRTGSTPGKARGRTHYCIRPLGINDLLTLSGAWRAVLQRLAKSVSQSLSPISSWSCRPAPWP